MKYKKLGKTGLDVSVICLGTMTYGKQNTQEEAFEQMDYALENGVNFLDTAEMYSVPYSKETQGKTEEIIGNWIHERQNRDQFILATKVTGPSINMTHISDQLGFSRERIFDAIEKSLRRLKTDYVDLYQLHWPERSTNFFGQRGYVHNDQEKWKDNFAEALDTLDVLIKAGKIKHWGLSNETPWGIMRTSQVANQFNHPSTTSIQNAYSLLNRTFESGLAEMAMRENISLLPYSPLAFGRLTDKYIDGTDNDESRINKFASMSRYNGKNSIKATELYYKLAKKNGMSLAQMALAFVNTRPFVASTIIGATTMLQLKENIATGDIELSAEMLKSINEIQEQIPNPAP